MTADELIQCYLSGSATDADVQQLNELLEQDPDLRRKFVFESGIDANLRRVALEQSTGHDTENNTISPIFRPVAWIASVAAIALLAVLAFSHFSKPEIIASLVSSENAAWESSLPTTAGSDLTAGSLKLTSGIATIRFTSGAEVLLEAPANLVLETPMRGKLLTGSAVITVPETAVGFIMETPDGYAVDHGTQFAVNVDQDNGQSSFEVLEGEISVHLPNQEKEVRLLDQEAASISNNKLQTYNGPLPEKEISPAPKVVKVRTNGKATSIIRSNLRDNRLDPDLLMLKNSGGGPQDRRALMSFDVSKVDLESVQSLKLGMKMVPSGIGFATRLPIMNTFAIYGVTDPLQEKWPLDCLWEDAPTLEDAIFLDSINVRRSRQDKYCVFSSEALLNFLKADRDGLVTLILVRESGQIPGAGPALVHAFAGPSHPEATGPIIRFFFKK